MNENPTLKTRTLGDREGMTLIEVLVAMTVLGVILSTALVTFTRQHTAYQEGLDRLTALRNARYAMSTLETDLQTMGTNVPADQPEMVYGGPNVIAFTADYATNLPNDPFAVYRTPEAPTGQVTLPTTAVSIPVAGIAFPDTTYGVNGLRSPAEMIIFFFEPDDETDTQDDYVLYRQVNGGAPERVAGGLMQREGEPFFAYLRHGMDANDNLTLLPVADSLMPLSFQAPVSDSIRAIRVNLRATNGLSGDKEREVELSRLIDLPNAGFGQLNTCGSAPLLGSALTATPVTLAGGDDAIQLSWTAATDETQGEKDVVRYVIWRRQVGATDWGDPYRAIPSGQGAYTFDDDAADPVVVYEYALAAQDCTPAVSTLSVSNPVFIP